jgi:membrane-bound lytic murein transglycosylase B
MTLGRITVSALLFVALFASSAPTGALEPSATGFDAWVSELRGEALDRNISASTLDTALAGVTLSEKVIDLDRKQPEFKLDFTRYLGNVINERRVRDGKRRLAQHRDLLREIETRYGVQPRFIVALWGIESDFGRRMGSFEVIQSLVTLAYDGRRATFFRSELFDALQILEEGHVQSGRMLGSWAGAVGQPQFMPSSFHSFAVDHDGDSRRDLWGSVPDVLASVANYLSRSGWKGDQIWGREVRLPQNFDTDLTGRRKTRALAEWQELGVRRKGGLRRCDRLARRAGRPGIRRLRQLRRAAEVEPLGLLRHSRRHPGRPPGGPLASRRGYEGFCPLTHAPAGGFSTTMNCIASSDTRQ